MPFFVIPYPAIDPVLFQFGPLLGLGPFQIRWYALAYVFGLILGWLYARWMVGNERFWGGAPHPTRAALDDLLVYTAFGVILGGRVGYVLFYNLSYYLDHPADVFAVWNGGMSFHGGLAGVTVALALFARRHKLPVLSIADVVTAAVPIGLFLGRLANFIKPELWGRPSDVPWAMVFPGAGPLPRHPSQLYEAALEGLALFLVLNLLVRRGALRRPGLVTGVFAVGYGAARIACEFFREPDPQLGFLFGGATMGMLLSIPVIALGLAVIAVGRLRPSEAP